MSDKEPKYYIVGLKKSVDENLQSLTSLRKKVEKITSTSEFHKERGVLKAKNGSWHNFRDPNQGVTHSIHLRLVALIKAAYEDWGLNYDESEIVVHLVEENLVEEKFIKTKPKKVGIYGVKPLALPKMFKGVDEQKQKKE